MTGPKGKQQQTELSYAFDHERPKIAKVARVYWGGRGVQGTHWETLDAAAIRKQLVETLGDAIGWR